MGWAEWRIQQFYEGEKANWFEKRIFEHANPVTFVLHILGAIPLVYGLWNQNSGFIVLGIVLPWIGHIYSRGIKGG